MSQKSNNPVVNLAEAKARQIRATKGRNSKNSSKVYCYRIEDLGNSADNNELTAFFGPVDAVERKMQYEGWR